MKLDYIADGSSACPLLRLHDFTPSEAAHLLTVMTDLATGASSAVEVHQLPFVQPIGSCQLTLVRMKLDQAVQRRGALVFECGFTADTWDNIAGLIAPFTARHSSHGYQWLATSPGEVAWLLSPSGQW